MSFREGERDEALSILQELSSAFGVSGFEEDVRGAIVRRVEPIVDELITDPLGNVHGVMNPQEDFTVLLVAHMDEIGFMVTSIDENGFLGVGPIGSWDPALALGKSVIIRGWDGNMEIWNWVLWELYLRISKARRRIREPLSGRRYLWT